MITGSGIWILVGVAFALLETKEDLISQVVIHSFDAMVEHFATAPKYSTNQIKEENLAHVNYKCVATTAATKC